MTNILAIKASQTQNQAHLKIFFEQIVLWRIWRKKRRRSVSLRATKRNIQIIIIKRKKNTYIYIYMCGKKKTILLKLYVIVSGVFLLISLKFKFSTGNKIWSGDIEAASIYVSLTLYGF